MEQAKLKYLSVQDILPNPNQPRKVFEESALRTLATSLKESGLLQPLSVRKRRGGGYELIAGERRFRAAVLAGFQKLPCLVLEKDESESAVLALVENIQRADLGFFEEAAAIKKLLDGGDFTQSSLAAKLGKAPCTLANKLRLLQLTEEEQQVITDHHLTERHARAFLSLPVGEERLHLIREAAKKGLNVAQTEDWIRRQADKKEEEKPRRILLIRDVRIFANTIKQAVATMQLAGIPADCLTKNTEDFLEYTIRIPLRKKEETAG